MSKTDLTTREAVLERFRDGLEWGIDDDDVPGYWPEDWELAGYLAECVRLREQFDRIDDALREGEAQGYAVTSAWPWQTLRDAMKGNDP